jgi:hypothetical protein
MELELKSIDEMAVFFAAVQLIKRCCLDERLSKIIMAEVKKSSEWQNDMRLAAKLLGDIPSTIFAEQFPQVLEFGK